MYVCMYMCVSLCVCVCLETHINKQDLLTYLAPSGNPKRNSDSNRESNPMGLRALAKFGPF